MDILSRTLDPQRFYESDDWYRLRYRVLVAADYKCAVCRADLHGKGRARVDHIVPVRQNWARRLDPTNLRALCPSCDNKRHSEKGRGGVEHPRVQEDGYPEGWG